jgi:hypothetical protein
MAVDSMDRGGPALGKAIDCAARNLDQELVEVGVVVEDRARGEPGPLRHVLHPHSDRASLEQHLARGVSQLPAPLRLILPPHALNAIRQSGTTAHACM